MGIKERVSTVLSQEVDRTEFLQHLGVAILGLLGLSAFFKAAAAQPTQHGRTHGFGSVIDLRR